MRTVSCVLAFFLAIASVWGAPAPQVGPCVSVNWGRYWASGVCIGSDGRQSLVLTNNHLFSNQPFPGAEFPLGNYPLAGKVESLDEKQTFAARGVGGDTEADLALVIVEGNLLSAPLSLQDAPEGTVVRHYGIGSKFSSGVVLAAIMGQPKSRFAATLRAVSGDSGAGIFDPLGQIVAINCGRHGMAENAPLRGTPVSAVHPVLRRLAGLVPATIRYGPPNP